MKSLDDLNLLLQRLEDNVVGDTVMTESTTREHMQNRFETELKDIWKMCELMIKVRKEVEELEGRVR